MRIEDRENLNQLSLSNVILGSINLEQLSYESVSANRLNLIAALSAELLSVAKQEKNSELMSLSRYLKNLARTANRSIPPGMLAKGCGLATHICSNNVPLGFAYSFFWGFLAGNSNLVKMPKKMSNEGDLFLQVLKRTLDSREFSEYATQNLFTQINSSEEALLKFLEKSHVRIIWGSDKTVSEIMKIPFPPDVRVVTFPDRISVCAISLQKYENLGLDSRRDLARKFVLDFASFNQLACSSPWVIYWLFDNKANRDKLHLIDSFWHDVDEFLGMSKNLFVGLGSMRLSKLSQIFGNGIDVSYTRVLKGITILGRNSINLGACEAGYGIFHEVYKSSVSEMLEDFSSRVQTLTYFGLDRSSIEDEVKACSTYAPRRIVPIGLALEFEAIWDGKDVLREIMQYIQLV